MGLGRNNFAVRVVTGKGCVFCNRHSEDEEKKSIMKDGCYVYRVSAASAPFSSSSVFKLPPVPKCADSPKPKPNATSLCNDKYLIYSAVTVWAEVHK